MGLIMEVPMSEIKEIKNDLKSLQMHAATTDVILKSIGETQKDIAEILKTQSAQEVKNKTYDDAIKKAELLAQKVTDNRVKIASAVAITTVTVGAVMKIAFTG